MSAPGALILAIDCGTQSVRALLFDAAGTLHARARQPLDAYLRPQPGWLEMDPEEFWRPLAAACRALWSEAPALRARVQGLVLTTQRGTVICLDREHRPLRPAIVWPDERRTAARNRLAPWWRAAFAVTGLRSTVRNFEQQAEANWIAAHEPGLWQRTARFVLLSGWLNLRLTGRLADAVGSQVGYLPFDFRRWRWAGRHDWKWQCLPLVPQQLCELVPSGSVLGGLTPQAAADLGLPAGLPVVAGAADKACEALGAGALTPEVAALSLGTTATIATTTPRYVEPLPLIPPYPAALPGHYSTEVQVPRGWWLVSAFVAQFAPEERARAAALGIAPEALLEPLLEATPPGADGLVLQPTWSPGIRWPGPEARGAIIGFGAAHGRAHVYRALVEGLLHALRQGRERIERASGTPVTALRVAGGGAQSDATLQIAADVFGLPAERPAHTEASGLGAAMLAAVTLGMHADATRAAAAMTRIGRRAEPRPEAAALHDALHRAVVARLYGRLQPLYRTLAALGPAPRP